MKKRSVYDAIVADLIKEMENGVMPWSQPWDGTAAIGLPMNASSGRCYSGMNVLALWAAACRNGHDSNAWVTFKQAREAGGSVRRGERGTKIVYAGRRTVVEEDRDGNEADREIPVLKVFTVFNLMQTTGTSLVAPERVQLDDAEVQARLATWIESLGVAVVHGGTVASYRPDIDRIRMPDRRRFEDDANYAATLTHELVHATGAAHRLNRDLSGSFGDPVYSVEEMCAEVGASLLVAELGIRGQLQHASYVAHWLRLLKEDPTALPRAARAAQQAADYVLRSVASPKAESAA